MRHRPGIGPKARYLVALAGVLLCSPPPPLQAQDLALSCVGDSVLLGAGVGAAFLSEYLLYTRGAVSLGPLEVEGVNGLDRLGLFPYSRPLDIASSVFEYSAMALPVLLAFAGSYEQAAALGVVYLETLACAYAAKNLLKYLFPRYRPYLYSPLPPGPGPPSRERVDSFPSGHATMAFAAATFGVYAFSLYLPSSPWLLPFGAASYGLAGLAASFRVFSGMHFITDVIAGAALGAIAGYVIPLLHSKVAADVNGKGLALQATPTLLLIGYSY